MARPFWSGHIQISLVSFAIQIFPATDAKGEIHFHQLDRKTGERIKHQNISADDEPIENKDIVKGYEYSKDEYVAIEPEDIENLRIPSRQTLDVLQFVDIDELDPMYFEKPYFVIPEGTGQLEAFAVVRRALQLTKKAGLGKIAFGGREHLLAIAAPLDETQLGIMAYVLRYEDELRNPGQFFAEIKPVKIDGDQLELAKELIKKKTAKFDAAKFKDEYEKALRAMVQAKISHVPQKIVEPKPKAGKVINLMDALRKSVGQKGSVDKKSPMLKKPGSSNKVTVLQKPKLKPAAKTRSA